MQSTPKGLQTKNHYEVLDGLRGVAALIVVAYHTATAYALDGQYKLIIGHGYLAVDFFFLLSGFVIAYAYDDRWNRMTQWDFYKRRLIRLQPMVIVGSLIGGALYFFQRTGFFHLVGTTPAWKVLFATVSGAVTVPLRKNMDVRGWHEMFPLNGPEWSLFIEYLANIFYAAGLRRLSRKVLGVFVALAAVPLIYFAVHEGNLSGGWASAQYHLYIGLARLLYPFFGGILLMRSGKRLRIKDPLTVCSLLLAAVLIFPAVGDGHHPWQNGMYDAFCILVIFPLIVATGAGAGKLGGMQARFCKFWGDLSYPLYITHYPLVLVYTAWVTREKIPLVYGAVVGVLVFCASIAIAYACLKLYDEPVREWLKNRFLSSGAKKAPLSTQST